MSKEEKFLVDCIVDDLASFLIEDKHLSIEEALNTVFYSQLYDRLVDKDTQLYTQSSAYNYEKLKQELQYGKLR